MENRNWLQRYEGSATGVFAPTVVIERGKGTELFSVDGRSFTDLLGGIAVSALGYGHPDLTEAIARQAAEVIHVSNLVTTPENVLLAEKLLELAQAPAGSGVFFANSGTEANEGLIKLARLTGRKKIIVAQGAFHGRSTGALALTSKAAYREPFAPLMPGVVRVPYGDLSALQAALDSDTAAVLLEPIQGEVGVRMPPAGYLAAAAKATRSAGALFMLDEIQTGVGRTGEWFRYMAEGVVPDAMSLAKGLAGGVPIGAFLTFGPEVTGLLQPGAHGTTFGGNPLACSAALTVLRVIERDGLLQHAREMFSLVQHEAAALKCPDIVEVRGAGLLLAVQLRHPVAAEAAKLALDAGFIVNAVAPDALRLAPPLVISAQSLRSFMVALSAILREAQEVS